MPITASPSTAFRTSVFYDSNNNPLNIPCEGPKAIPVLLAPDTTDGIFVVDFNNLFTSGQISSVQAVSIDLSPYAGISGDPLIITTAGLNQSMYVYLGADVTAGPGYVFISVPLPCLNPAKIEFDFSNLPSIQNLQATFYNYMTPSFTLQSSLFSPPPT